VLKAGAGGYKGEIPIGFHIKLAEGMIGSVAQTGEALVANDVSKEPNYLFIEELTDTRSELAVPIRIGTTTLGVLDIESTEINAFDKTEMFTAQTLADQIAIAIENARLYQDTRDMAVLEERNRLARDLHDAVSQTLFSTSLIAEVVPSLWEKNQDEGRRRLEEVRQLTKGALAEMRMLLLELRPAALLDTELEVLLRQLAESITGRARIPVEVKVKGQCTVSPDVKVALYRIAQEALNNVAKHAGAREVKVNLLCKPDKVTLKITDDGKGFDMSRVPSDSLGVGIMRERARDIGASLSVQSWLSHGTEIMVVWDNLSREGKL
jgi:signal transduction histidine kinase